MHDKVIWPFAALALAGCGSDDGIAEISASPTVLGAGLNRAGSVAIDRLEDADEELEIVFHLSEDPNPESFRLKWSFASEVATSELKDWSALGSADEGEFLSIYAARQVSSFCRENIAEGLYGTFGTNRGYQEGFCRLMTSNSIDWSQVR